MAKISSKNIAEAIYEATEGKGGADLAHVFKNGVKVLSKKRMLGQSADILKALQDIIDKKSGTVRARVITAKKLDSGNRKNIEDQIKQKYKADRVESEFLENIEVLGGMRIEVGDEITDSTYKSRLGKLENFLIHSS